MTMNISEVEAVNPVVWIERQNILLDGREIDLAGHRYQLDQLQEPALKQCCLKGAQIGQTSIIMLNTIHGMIHGKYPQGCLYLFPTRDDVTDFSRGRLSPLLTDNPQIGAHLKDTDAANTKRVGGSMLYLRGARATKVIQGAKRSSTQLKSVPVDRVVFDEVDEMTPDMIDMALERMSHSEIKEEVYLSTPSIPDYGIDALYQQSDQRVWMIRCSACNKETCLELSFPECVKRGQSGTAYRACVKCGKTIYPRDGRWVAQKPGAAFVGWWISQLNSAYVDPGKILELYHNPPGGRLQEVYNSKLGQAYIEATHRLSIEEILACCGDSGIQSHSRQSCTMGVDQGRDLHVVIGKRHPDKKGEIVHLGIYKDWADLDGLMKTFRVSRCVVDALPEQRNAREFALRHKDKVYCNFYQEHRKGAYAWNERDFTVSCNRTESLDASHNELQNGDVVLPRQSEISRLFALQCHNIAKRLEEDETTGAKTYRYVKLSSSAEDHFRHAFNYECMARQFGLGGVFGQLGSEWN